MSEHEHSAGGVLRKNIFFILATLTILAIVGYAIVTSQSTNWETSSAPSASIPASLVLTSSPSLSFANVNFPELSLKFSSPSGLIIQDSALDTTATADVTMKNYKGKLLTDGKTLTLDGTAENIYVNNVGLKNEEKRVSVKTEKASFDSLVIPVTQLTSVEYRTSGDIKLSNGRLSFTISDEPLTVKNYQGSLVIDSSFTLNGSLGSISIPGVTIQG